MDKLYIVIPAYNESENISKVIDDWYPIVAKIGNGSKLVVIDDGSKDTTYEIMCQVGEMKEFFEPIRKQNSGHGATILYGYQYAIEAGADYIFQTDSDGQTEAKEFWEFWDKRQKFDMVIGHRKGRQDGFSRVLVTKILKGVLFVSFRVNIKDANTPFRLMKASTLKEYMHLIPEGFNLSNVIISVIYGKKKREVHYMPVTFRPRQGGVNSINMKRIIGIGKQAIKDFKIINQSLKG